MTPNKNFPLFLVLATTLLYLTSDIYLPDSLVVQKDMHLTDREVLITISAWFAGSIVFTPFAGFISIAFGRRNCLVTAIALFALLNGTIFLVDNPYFFIIFRFLQGVLASLVSIPGYAAIHEFLSDEESIKITSWMNSIIVMSPLLGPLLGGILLLYIPWRMNFLILGALAFCLIYPLYSSTPSLSIAKKSTKQTHANAYYSRSNALYFVYLIGITCVMSVNTGWIFCSPLVYMQEFGLSPIQYGLTEVIICSAFILGSMSINQLITAYGKEKLFHVGKWVLPFSLISSFILLFLPKSLFLLIAVASLLTYFFGFIAPLYSRILMSSNRLKKDHAIAIINSFFNLGAIGGIFCSLFIYHGNYFELIKFQVVIGVLLLVLSLTEGFLTQGKTLR